MRGAAATLITLGLVAGSAPPASQTAPKPVSVAGKWVMTLETEAFTATTALELKQDGETLTGTYTGRYGAFALAGKIKERALEFAFKMTAEGMEVLMAFTGEVAADGETIKGRASLGELGDATWSAKREKGSYLERGTTLAGSYLARGTTP